ncbi:hypothetical protein CPter91_4407 [Collimonas pratensis]|uniref:Uncharacterized protein n=1 Tax=Collimonas pratensis TaxID=279113 RepID=A0A127Q9N5_9BURK|nr:hypothetical protein CPter91_4407 [Collimonas pratensis]
MITQSGYVRTKAKAAVKSCLIQDLKEKPVIEVDRIDKEKILRVSVRVHFNK